MGANGRNSGAAVQAGADALETSRTDARVLLWFATREGKKVDQKVLQDVVNAESNLRHQERTWDNEAKFWTAYRDLAAAVKPASVESVLSTCEHPFAMQDRARQWKLGNAGKTKRRYTCGAVGVLITLLLIQTYWFVVAAFSANLEKNRDELDRIAGDLRLMTVLAEEIRQESPVDTAGQMQQEKHLPDLMLVATNREQEFGEHPQLLDLIKRTIEGLLANQPMLAALVLTRDTKFQLTSVGSLALKNKKYRKERLIAMMANEVSVLQHPWKALWHLSPTDEENDQDSNGYMRDFAKLAVATNMPQTGSKDVEVQFWEDLQKEQEQINSILTNEALEKVLSQSKSMPPILSQYFLPMLYGLLGSLTFILRTLSREIYDVTFTRASAAGYSLRWPLGMLAGVTVGLFFDPTSFAGLAAITPLGIAFLAGYGVELFFTALDGLVRTFTRRDGPERPKAEAA